MITLGSLCIEEPSYGTSATAIERTDSKQPKYIRITDFDDFGIESDHEFMTAEKYSEKHFLEEGDILFARTGASVGKTFYYYGDIGSSVFAGYCIRFRFDQEKVVRKFIYWYTKTQTYIAWVNGIQRPSGQPNINKEEYKSHSIALPSKAVQQMWADYLDNALTNRNSKIKEAKQLIEKSKQLSFSTVGISFKNYSPSIFSYLRKHEIDEYGIYCNPYSAYLVELFEGMSTNQCYAGHLEEFVDVNPQTSKSSLTDESIVTFVPMSAVSEKLNHAEYETRTYGEVKTGFTVFQRNDLLWAKITPCMQNGKSFLANDIPTEIGFGSTEFHVLRQKSKRIHMPYLWTLLSEQHVLEAAQGMFSGSAGQQRVPEAFLKKFPIVLPPIEVQQMLSDEVFKAQTQAKLLRDEAERGLSESIKQFEQELLGA
jgi:type I restriction enzyme S subunit